MIVSVDDERVARASAWTEVRELVAANSLDARAVNEVRQGGLRLFYGGRGIWRDKQRTNGLAPDGVTVGVLHTGRSYADDLLPDGIVYHYPRTAIAGSDAGDVAATKATKELGLPLFVVVQPDSTSRRLVHQAWVEEWDDSSELFLITFGDAAPVRPVEKLDDGAPFELERSDESNRRGSRSTRRGQHRFSFRVFRRYGTCCAVCEVAVMGLLDAAHLRPYAEGGSNDERNGLVLCATHHRAFDKRLFGIDPATYELAYANGAAGPLELGITRDSLVHLPAPPHAEALVWCWARFVPIST